MSASKRKGTAWESAVVNFLRANGFPAVERRALSGSADRGDVAGVSGWVIEAKATRSIDLAQAVDEARTEAANAGASWHAAVIKRRMRPAGDGYAVMSLAQLARLIAAANGGTISDNTEETR